MHILIDQDDTIAHWGPHKDQMLAEHYPHLNGFFKGEEVVHWDLMHGLDAQHQAAMIEEMNRPGFYSELKPIDGAVKALNEMIDDGHTVTIVSTPWSTNPTCMADKHDWLERHLGPGWGKRLILTNDKTAVRGDVLIDDKTEITGQYKPEWRRLIFDQPHNRGIVGVDRLHHWNDWRLWVLEELPPLIGIGGRLRSGKDTVADYLVEQYGFVKMGMSDPLNDAMAKLNPIVWPTGGVSGMVHPRRYSDYVQDLGYTEAKNNPEVRRLLQKFGTEVGRDLVGESVWVDIAIERIQAARRAGNPVILTGIRFQNELQMIRNLGGLPTWVEREGLEPVDSHPSENGVLGGDFDVTIKNSDSLEHLYELVDNFADKFDITPERIAA